MKTKFDIHIDLGKIGDSIVKLVGCGVLIFFIWVASVVLTYSFGYEVFSGDIDSNCNDYAASTCSGEDCSTFIRNIIEMNCKEDRRNEGGAISIILSQLIAIIIITVLTLKLKKLKKKRRKPK